MSIWTILFVVLLISWIGGFTVFHVAGGLIHLLLVFAVISLILHFVMGRRTAQSDSVVCERAVVERQDSDGRPGYFYGTSRHTLRRRNDGTRHRPIPTLGMCRYQGSKQGENGRALLKPRLSR